MTTDRGEQSAEHAPLPTPGMIIREGKPLNLEMPIGSLSEFITRGPFFVRCHFPVPQIDVKTWQLSGREVGTPLKITRDELMEMEAWTLP